MRGTTRAVSSLALSLTSTIACHDVVYVVYVEYAEQTDRGREKEEKTRVDELVCRPNFEEQGPTIVVPSESVSLTPGFCTSCMVAYSED